MRRLTLRKLLTDSQNDGAETDDDCPICRALRESGRAPDMVLKDEFGETLVYSLDNLEQEKKPEEP